MQTNWNMYWQQYLANHFHNEIPDTAFPLNLADIDFYIYPLLATTAEGIRVIQKHNAKIGIFS